MKIALIAAFAVAAVLAGPAMAEEALTTTPELALPEPESMTAPLPHSMATEVAPMAVPEPETEAIAPYRGCNKDETVYLTN